MPPHPSAAPQPRFGKRPGWARRPLPGTSGHAAGTTGASPAAVWRAALCIAALVIATDTVNVFTVLADSRRFGTNLSPWQPIVWEATSGAAILAVSAIAYRAIHATTGRKRDWPRTLLIHAVASLGFSILHVALMTAARSAIYALAHLHYPIRLADWPYEYRKDVLSYAVLCAIFWVFTRSTSNTSPRADTPQPAPSFFDITDGPNLTRVQLSEIIAIRAAANYVDFILADGRTRLMRASLSDMDAQLSPHGFVRTHRSWLVNPTRISSITATGSNDYSLLAENGATYPLSRRYPAALRALRNPHLVAP